jgi:hypothetical protein
VERGLRCASAVLVLLACSCAGHPPLPIDPDGGVAADGSPIDGPGPADRPADTPADDGPVEGSAPIRPQAYDVLFVIDSSTGMAPATANLVRLLPGLVETLRNSPGGLPDLHIGVTSGDLGAGPTSMGACRPGGDRGVLRLDPACGLDPGARFIVASQDGAGHNFRGQLGDVFGCLARVGNAGCEFQHPLEAARLALDGTATPENQGFLRPGATLAVIVISNQDDCSAPSTSNLFVDDGAFPDTTPRFRCAQTGHLCAGKTPPIGDFSAPLSTCTAAHQSRLLPVADIVASIRARKTRGEKVLASAIIGWATDPDGTAYRHGRAAAATQLDYLPICLGTAGPARAALRIKEFVDSFPGAEALVNICQEDWLPAIRHIGERL